MICLVYYRNDGSGILLTEARDGDVLEIRNDNAVISDQEQKSFLCIQVPESTPAQPYEANAVRAALQDSEYGVGPDGDVITVRFRRYKVDWRKKFTAAEQAIITDPLQTLGTIANRFVVTDFYAKN